MLRCSACSAYVLREPHERTERNALVGLVIYRATCIGMGEYVNSAYVLNNITGRNASPVATATVRIVPDPTFDCTDIIGKVFDDGNLNGYQDQDEKGIPGVRIASAFMRPA